MKNTTYTQYKQTATNLVEISTPANNDNNICAISRNNDLYNATTIINHSTSTDTTISVKPLTNHIYNMLSNINHNAASGRNI